MTDYVSERIARELGVANLPEILSEQISGADLHSLLLAVIKRRLSKVEPSRLIEASAVSKACDLDARLINRVESIAYSQAEEFDAIEL